MKDQLWNLFRETGDPRTYLLYKAGGKQEKKRNNTKKKPQKPPQKTPSASC